MTSIRQRTESAREIAPRQAGVPAPTQLVPSYLDEFSATLPPHIRPETFVQMALSALRRSPQLMAAAESDPGSLIHALRDAARKGLEPGTEQYYLTPRKNKGRLTVLGITGYQGEVEMMYRAGAVSSVVAEVVHERDDFDYVPGLAAVPTHRIDWMAADRGPVVLAYAYGRMRDGATSRVVVVNAARIARARASSASAGSSHSPWESDEAAMWLKTAVHDLRKWVPTAAKFRWQAARVEAGAAAEATARHTPPPPPPLDVDTTTGELVSTPPPAAPGSGYAPAPDPDVVVEDPPGWDTTPGDPA